MSTNVPYELRELDAGHDSIVVQLFVEGRVVATARVRNEVLDDMRTVLGMDQEAVKEALHSSLLDHLKHQLEKVTVSPPMEVPGRQLVFASQYTFRDFDDLETGMVWYDVQASRTWPESVPALVRNKLRLEVHRKLTGAATTARELLDLHE